MRIRAHCHTDPAIRSNRVPVAKTSVGVEEPTPGSIYLDTIIEGDGAAGAVLGAFLTKSAKIDDGTTIHPLVWC
jgi:hypothetical protein